MGAIIIVDAFWGDAGKGKVSAFLCQKYRANLCVRAGTGTNAGHSIYLQDGRSIVFRQLPLGLLNKTTLLRVGSGVTVDPCIFLREVQQWQLQDRAKVDFRCSIITDRDKEIERKHPIMLKIDSTKSGCGSARANFIMRAAKQAKDLPKLHSYVADVAKEVNEQATKGIVVVEGSQGTYMSLALSPDYPYVTSDNCTTASFIDDGGLSWKLIDRVIMLVKSLPTRVGEGPLPHEMDPKEVARRSLQEYGVVTGRPRRKSSTIDLDKLKYVAMLNGPTEMALTFCDHYDPSMKDETRPSKITDRLRSLIKKIERTVGVPVTLLDTGKWFDSFIDLY